jgi:signal transduction histidine kinase
MSSAFVREPSDQIDRAVDAWLKQVVLRFGLDRSTVAELDPVTGIASLSHGWARQKYPVIGQPLDANVLVPWLRKKMLAEEVVVFSKVSELPAEAAGDIERLGPLMPKSNVTMPIKLGGVVVGAVGFGAIRHERNWSKRDIRELRQVADILGHALERRRRERELLRLRNEISHLSRLNTMGELSASLAHELNQPLSAILSNSEAIQAMLLTGPTNLNEIKEAIADIIGDSRRAHETIVRLRSMFGREELRTSVLDLGELVSEVSRLVRKDALVHCVTFELEVERPLPTIRGDRVQLQQGIINLVLNAFESVSTNQYHPREVLLAVNKCDVGSVCVLVRDSGAGIDARLQPRIFDPFFTTKPRGLGIGLAITRRIVEGHDGQLSVLPNRGRGVTFKMIFPAIEMQLEQAPTPARAGRNEL